MNNAKWFGLLLCWGIITPLWAQWKSVRTDSMPTSSHTPIQLHYSVDQGPSYSPSAKQRADFQRDPVNTNFKIETIDKPLYKVLKKGKYGFSQWTEWPVTPGLRSQNPLATVWKNLTGKANPQYEVRMENRPSLLRQGQSQHMTYRQYYQGYPIYDSEVKIHHLKGKTIIDSPIFPEWPETPKVPSLTAEAVNQLLQKKWALSIKTDLHPGLPNFGVQHLELQWYFDDDGHRRLIYVVDYMPSVKNRYHVLVDAHSGDILSHHNTVCHIHHFSGMTGHNFHHGGHKEIHPSSSIPLNTEVGIGQDLNGITYQFPVWQSGSTRYLMDASEPMFDLSKSDMPTKPHGAIITLDGQNKSYEADDFGLVFVTSTSQNFDHPSAVSAHVNAILTYQYFYENFGFNSIDGQGNNVLSIVDVRDEDNLEMDNAFWNGSAVFYGNGGSDFHSPLSRSLDVGAHELTHGVVQFTGNLRYMGESGALNESFADIFAVLIDRDDYTIGEDIVNTQIFSRRALRDLSNPNNGGSQLGDIGWQPNHVNQQYFGELDAGGVHINSGIPNYAFYLIAEAIGKNAAEQIYFEVLQNYMTPRSDFKDLRLSVLTVAENQFGISSTQYQACQTAFNTVGIVTETPTQTMPEVLNENPGQSYMFAVGEDNEGLILASLSDNEVIEISGVGSITSKPSITDDGTFMVFIDGDHAIKYVSIDWDNLTVTVDYLEQEPQEIWRNVVVSKEGRFVALTTETPIDPNIYILDRSNGDFKTIELYNPTTASNLFTIDNVKYADAMEFDHTSEYLVYDAYNEVDQILSIENIGYWDIGIIQVFDRSSQSLITGQVEKIFQNLDSDISVGNPSFAKNHVNVIAFDYIDESADEYYLGTANIATGEAQLIHQGNTILYPTFTKDDRFILFNHKAGQGQEFQIGGFEVSDNRLEKNGVEFAVINDYQWGVPFANGSRSLILTSTSPSSWVENGLQYNLYPNPVDEICTIESTKPEFGITSIELIDSQGRRLFQQSYAGLEARIELNMVPFPVGIYAVKIRMKSGDLAVKRLVKH